MIGLIAKTSDPRQRLPLLDTLLDICIHTEAADCAAKYTTAYIADLKAAPQPNPIAQREVARRGVYFFEATQGLLGIAPKTILDEDKGYAFNSANVPLYLEHALLVAEQMSLAGNYQGSEAQLDRVLSLIASLKNPSQSSFEVAWALSETIELLVVDGDAERAWGLYKTAGGFIVRTLPAASLDAVRFHYTEATIFEQVGNVKGAATALAVAEATLHAIETDPNVGSYYLSAAYTLNAVDCALAGDRACADAALENNPLKASFAAPGRVATTYPEITYLASRALVQASEGRDDPAIAFALRTPSTPAVNILAGRQEIYRTLGEALSLPHGPEQQAALRQARTVVLTALRTLPSASFGAWYRPSSIDRVILALLLSVPSSSTTTDDEDAFEIFQLSGRGGQAFDADALTILAQARSDGERRELHQALRLRARRDQLERDAIAEIVAAASQPGGTGFTQFDVARQMVFRDFNARIAQASQGEPTQVASRVVTLSQFRQSLGPHDAALYVAEAAGGAAYMCVRRDGVFRSQGPVDWKVFQQDGHLLQLALTADYAPSASADSQFPVAASIRLYDALIKPFASCLKPADHIIWLRDPSSVAFPLSVLLDSAPPKLGDGYDLSKANWLARRYSVSYAGAPSVIAAARSHPRRTADFGFLGIGDPTLSGTTPSGQDRAAILAKAVGGSSELADLPPLPETAAELTASAKGFPQAIVLTKEHATIGDLRAQLVGSYQFLSFATHGLNRGDMQGLSGAALVLTPGSEAEGDDGLLTASAIADMNLSADFVALSACNTAHVDFSQMSEDLPALASAFEVAGVPATLGTLWPVNSVSATRITSSVFSSMRQASSIGPAEALANAQRRFLAAPPSSAYLHPRFWAPFVVLGDGGTIRRADDRREMKVSTVETLTTNGGEVLRVARTPDGLLERFLSDRNGAGRYGSAVRAVDNAGHEIWRRENWQVGAAEVVAKMGDTVITGGYQAGSDGHTVAVLEAFAATTGSPRPAWTADEDPALNGTVVSALKLEPGLLLVATLERSFATTDTSPQPRARFFKVDGSLKPSLLFEATLGLGGLDQVAMAQDKDGLVVTYSNSFAPAALSDFSFPEDSYDGSYCALKPRTLIERRDAVTGAVTKARTVEGLSVRKLLVLPNGDVIAVGMQVQGLQGGRSHCEERAVVLRLDKTLQATTVYVDARIGTSLFNDIAISANGELVAVGRKETVVDYSAAAKRGTTSFLTRPKGPTEPTSSGMVVVMDQTGTVRYLRMLDAGSDVFASAVDANDPKGLIVGGMVGDRATIFHMSIPQAQR